MTKFGVEEHNEKPIIKERILNLKSLYKEQPKERRNK